MKTRGCRFFSVALGLWLLVQAGPAVAVESRRGFYVGVELGFANAADLNSTVSGINHPTRCDQLLGGVDLNVAGLGDPACQVGGALSVRANDLDMDTAQNALTVSRVTAPAHGTLTLNPDGTFIYVHNGDEEDSDFFTYRVNDGALNSAPATVTITVTQVNDAPVAVADAFTVAEGGTATTLASGATSVRDNDRDAETATNELTVSVDTEPANGALTLNPDGTFSYEHDGGETTSDFFTYIVNDTYDLTVTATAGTFAPTAAVTVTVTDANDPPMAFDDTAKTTEDEAVEIDVLDNDRDVDAANDILTVVAINNTPVTAGAGQAVAVMNGGTLTLIAGGNLNFNPVGAFDALAPDESNATELRTFGGCARYASRALGAFTNRCFITT